MSLRSQKNQLLLIIAVSVLFRLGAAFYMGNQVVELPGTADQLSYHTLAIRVANGFGFTFESEWWPMTKPGAPTAHWSFLYSFFLVAVYKLFGPNPLVARMIQAFIVGILHPYLVYLLGNKIFNKSIGVLSAGLTAIYVYFIYYSAALMTEPFYITAILASIFLSILIVERYKNTDKEQPVRGIIKLAALLGLTLGIAVLLRQLFLLVIPFLFLWVVYSVYKGGGRSAILPLLFTTFIIGVMIIPFTIYNFIRFDRFVLLNTNAGYAMYWANHPIHGTDFIAASEMPNYQTLIPADLRSLDEAALDQALLKLGFQFVFDDIGRYLLLSINRISDYFTFWPSPKSGILSNFSRVGSFGIMLPFIIIGLWFGLKSGWDKSPKKWLASPVSILLLFSSVYTNIHLLTWSSTRYRLPVDSVLIIFAGFAFWHIYNKLFSKQKYASRQIP